MSTTQELAEVVTAANVLTQTVTDKIASIDNRVVQFENEARAIASTATAEIYRARIGSSQSPAFNITPSPSDDTGALVQQAFSDGYKHVSVDWPADGQDRHWNTAVLMPIGATLFIDGAPSGVEQLQGSVRTDRACFNFGRRQGTSTLGSPMFFKNTRTSSDTYPYSDHVKVWDETSLITASGNNMILFGDGTYFHEQGGMCVSADGNGLIAVSAYGYDTPTFVGGGGHFNQFYLSGPLVNNRGGTSTCEVRFMNVYFCKVSSDGPPLTADKGFRRLLDKGVAGVTSALLNKQPYELTAVEAGYNDNVHSGTSIAWVDQMRGIGTEADRPRLIANTSWAHPGGWTLCQFWGGEGQCSLQGLERIAGTDTWIGSR